MGAEVVDLPGIVRVPPPAERPDPLAPDADVVSLLEHLLARAKAGEMRAIGAAWVRSDGEPAFNWAGANGVSLASIIGALMFLVHEITCAGEQMSTRDPWEPEEGA